MAENFLIYGSYGYTGELILERALNHGLRPILAGRNAAAVAEQAKRHGLESRAFDVSDSRAATEALAGVRVLLNCAGPFRATAQPMLQACLHAGAHYLDITGEIDVFEALAQRDRSARQANIMVLPGVGLDVVPTDCIAAYLKTRLPDATSLVLGLQGFGGGMSRGTATTMVEGFGQGGAVRRDGQIVRVPAAWKMRDIDFGNGPARSVLIPWGDVSTAYHSTGIGNVEVYTSVPATLIRQMRMTRYIGWFLRLAPVQRRLKRRIQAGPPGPSTEARAKSSNTVWGQATNDAGAHVTARLYTPNGYTLTAMTAVGAVQNALAGRIKPGFQTPSSAFGADFILQFEGARREDVA